MNAYEVLSGYEKFRDRHLGFSRANRSQEMFAVFVTHCFNDRRQARTVIRECLDSVAKNLREECQRKGVPLWPTVVANGEAGTA